MDENVILSLNHITKTYPGVVALNDVSLNIRKGEVHALVGENGAGKSTLIKTISGAIRPDSGEITIDGHPYHSLAPVLSQKSGIATIYQEFNLVPVLSVAENIFLGEFVQKGWICDNREMNRMASGIFEKLHVRIDPSTPVENLTTGYQQVVEIAKAISKNARILIMDEPTAPLATTEVEAMFDIVRLLKQNGVTVIYISHRMDEIFTISDRVTVMRDGQYVATKQTAETDKEELISLMVGRKLSETYPPRPQNDNSPLLTVRHLCGNGLQDVSFDVKKGEILGLGGLMGCGRTELVQLIFGYRPIESGEILLEGKTLKISSPMDAIRNGIALIPEDRKTQGLLTEMSIRDNITMPLLKRMSRAGVIPEKEEAKISQRQIQKMRIKTSGMAQAVKGLSGGNQQKVVLAKWLSTDPQILIMDEPTRGIDVGAKQEIYQIMVDLIKGGKTIIMISSDMEELIGMSDRLVVLHQGHVAGEIEKSDFTQENILKVSQGGNLVEKVG